MNILNDFKGKSLCGTSCACSDRDKGNSCQHCNAITVHTRAARVGRENARELSHFHMSSTESTVNEEWEGTGKNAAAVKHSTMLISCWLPISH